MPRTEPALRPPSIHFSLIRNTCGNVIADTSRFSGIPRERIPEVRSIAGRAWAPQLFVREGVDLLGKPLHHVGLPHSNRIAVLHEEKGYSIFASAS
jgi:hypothetical protein